MIDNFTFFLYSILIFQSSQVSTESNASTPGNKTDEKVGDGKYSTHSLDEVAGMIQNTLTAYADKVSILAEPTYYHYVDGSQLIKLEYIMAADNGLRTNFTKLIYFLK